MEAIFKKDNVYVAIEDESKGLRDGIDVNETDSLILCYGKKTKNYLYGGRVYLTYERNYGSFCKGCVLLKVDGINIRKFVSLKDNNDIFLKFVFRNNISISQAAAFLNQIENLGIDSFLENYRNQLQETKKEIEAQAESLSQELSIQPDEEKAKSLAKLRSFISELICIIFCLLINMNAGLDNHLYTEAYNEIISLYCK